MNVLPIVIRELRVASRGARLYRVRFWTAVAAIACGSYLMLWLNSLTAAAARGSLVLASLTGAGLLYCAILAWNAADCVSREKREGTLGLLFLTDLRGFDVVLGKLCANALQSLYGLIAAFPVAACVLVLGGVALQELWRVLLALLNAFFFSHAAGLLVSTFSRDQRRATGGTIALLAAFLLGPPALAAWLRYQGFASGGLWVEWFSPAYACTRVNLTGAGVAGFWPSLLLVQLCAWLFLSVASTALPHCWQERSRRTGLPGGARFGRWCFGSPSFRARLRQRLLDINPFLWLVSRNRLGSILVWAILALVLCAWSGLVAAHGLANSLDLFVLVIFVNHSVIKFWMVSESCAHLGESRRNGALELLLACTPFSVADILRGQWQGLRRRFFAPLLAVLLFDALLIALSLALAFSGSAVLGLHFVAIAITAMILLVADFIAIGWVGMWRAMWEKRPRLAVLQTILRVMVVPTALVSLTLVGVPAADRLGTALIFWPLCGLGFDVVFAATARLKLLTEFRAQTAVPPDIPLGLLGELGQLLGK